MTREELEKSYENRLNKTKPDYEVMNYIFCNPDAKPVFKNMQRAKTVCTMYIRGDSYAKISKNVCLSVSYCSKIIRTIMLHYHRRLEAELFELSKTCQPSNIEYLINTSKCAAYNNPAGVEKFAKALLTLPDDLYDYCESEKLAYLINWLHMEKEKSMRIYRASIYDKEVNKQHEVLLAVLVTKNEKDAYSNEDYESLFRNSAFSDNEIFYYLNQNDIKNPDGNPAQGTYDFFTVTTATCIE